MPDYRLHPGYVLSQYDGDEHYISAAVLADLYGVDLVKCHIVDSRRPSTMVGLRDNPDAIHLFPRYDGGYTIQEDS